MRDELLNVEEFGSLLEAHVAVEAWSAECNTYRPHLSLGGLTAAEYFKSGPSTNRRSIAAGPVNVGASLATSTTGAARRGQASSSGTIRQGLEATVPAAA